MPRIYEPVRATANKSDGAADTKKTTGQEPKTAAKNAEKKDNGSGDK